MNLVRPLYSGQCAYYAKKCPFTDGALKCPITYRYYNECEYYKTDKGKKGGEIMANKDKKKKEVKKPVTKKKCK